MLLLGHLSALAALAALAALPALPALAAPAPLASDTETESGSAEREIASARRDERLSGHELRDPGGPVAPAVRVRALVEGRLMVTLSGSRACIEGQHSSRSTSSAVTVS